MGLLTKKDSLIYRNFFKEMAKLRGIPVQYRYAVTSEMSIHAESKTTLSQAIPMDIIFDENPKISTLKTIGWISENPNDKPYIAMLPFDAPNLTAESIISIPPIASVKPSRDFKVTTINTLIEFPDCWVCTLAPIFNSDIANNVYDESNYNKLENKDTPNNEPPGNYSFLNVDDC